MKLHFSNLLFFFSILAFSVQGQDLLQQTRMSTSMETKNGVPNELSKLIQQERTFGVFQKVQPLQLSQEKLSDYYKNEVSDAVYYDLDIAQLSQMNQQKFQNIELNIPVNDTKSFDLELTQVQLLTSDFVLRTSDGQQLSFDENVGLFYRGLIKGQPNSVVALSVYKKEIRALIADESGNYILGKLPYQTDKYILYNDKKLQHKNSFQCGSEDIQMNLGEDLSPSTKKMNNFTNCVEIYVECDFSMYQSHDSNLTNVQNYTTSLLNEVAMLYQNENISIQLSEVYVWTSIDPYATINTTLGVLEKFGEERQNNYDGRLAHLISTRSLGGGIAWLNVLCRDYTTFMADWDGDGIDEIHHSGPYAFSANLNTSVIPVPTYSWDVEVFAHEMGHNFGSPHTQKCVWGATNDAALDDCYATEGGCAPGPTPTNGGTIMSYCHLTDIGINFNNGFGQQPGDLIRDRYNNATCQLLCEDNQTCFLNCPDDIIITCNDDYTDVNITGMATADCGGATVNYSDELFLNTCAGYVLRTFTADDGTVNSSCVQRIDIIEVSYEGEGFQKICSEVNSEWLYDVVPTTDGGSIAVGNIMLPNKSDTDVYIAKMDAEGIIEWSKTYGSTGNEEGRTITKTADGGYFIAGKTSSVATNRNDIYALKISATGDLIWSNSFLGGTATGASGYGIQTPDGGYLIAGTRSGLSIPEYSDVSAIKMDANGNLEWSKVYGGDNNDWITAVTNTADGGYVLLCSSSSYPRIGYTDVLVIKINSMGNIVWSKKIGTTADDKAGGMFEEANGDLLIAGVFSQDASGGWYPSNYQLALTKLSSTGNLLWSKAYAGGKEERGMKIIPTLDGNYALSGRSNAISSDGEFDGLLLKVNPTGDLLWAKTYGDQGDDFLYSLHSTADNGYMMAGYHASFGSTDPTVDNWFIKTDENGFIGTCDVATLNLTTESFNPQVTNFPLNESVLNVENAVTTLVEDYTLPCFMPCEVVNLPLRFIVGDVCEALGNAVRIPVKTEGFTDINGFQFSIFIDPDFATITDVSGFGLQNWDNSDFTIDTSNGTITLTREAVDITAGESVPDQTVLFYIDVEVIGTTGNSYIGQVQDTPTQIVVTQNNEDVVPELVAGTLCVLDLFHIKGHIYTYDNRPIYDVAAAGYNENLHSDITDMDGFYHLPNIDYSSIFTLSPYKTSGLVTDAVDINDIIAIKNHLLGNQSLANSYQRIAADADGNHIIDVVDMIFIKKIIRAESNLFPINKFWRFVPHDYLFPNPDDPFEVPFFPENREYSPLDMNHDNQDFIGVKIGDVNNDFGTN